MWTQISQWFAQLSAKLDWLTHPALLLGVQCAIAVAISLLLFRVAYALAVRFFADQLLMGHLIRRCQPLLQWLLPIVGIGIVLAIAPDTFAHIELLRQIDSVLLIATFTFTLVRGIDSFADWVLRRYRLDLADNLVARRMHTQTRVLSRSLIFITLLLGLSGALMTFPAVRHFGVSLLASAGVAGLAIGLAAKSVLGNLLAGVQIALTQPIRLDDVLVIQGEWGRVEEITSTYVVLAIWDQRRLVIPLQWFIENPFANWTHKTAQIIGTVFIWVDFSTPLEPLRAELLRLVQSAPEWDGRVQVMQVTDTNANAMQVRSLCSAPDSGRSFDLCCKVREGLLAFLQREYPNALPRLRVAETSTGSSAPPASSAQTVISPTP